MKALAVLAVVALFMPISTALTTPTWQVARATDPYDALFERFNARFLEGCAVPETALYVLISILVAMQAISLIAIGVLVYIVLYRKPRYAEVVQNGQNGAVRMSEIESLEIYRKPLEPFLSVFSA
ncbi:hypothetical protein PENTCL1PPCAC_7922 [Pristionchus entomophagus]|uniref:Uncharacterized protein n=1 Tax=Pristionchus entomophagus TaxID=358040 RepID=A0AAV5SSI9_9BILA|nr:hypothetical protein PENTCL1PPCAC_7922 [Pristionchus entomophagus]